MGNRRRYHDSEIPTLYVRQVHFSARPEDLRVLFERTGPVRDVYIPLDYYTRESRGFAYVKYEYRRDAELALNKLDGSYVMGRRIQVEWAEGSRKSRVEMQMKDPFNRNRRYQSRSQNKHRGRSPGHHSRRSRSYHSRHSDTRSSRSASKTSSSRGHSKSTSRSGKRNSVRRSSHSFSSRLSAEPECKKIRSDSTPPLDYENDCKIDINGHANVDDKDNEDLEVRSEVNIENEEVDEKSQDDDLTVGDEKIGAAATNYLEKTEEVLSDSTTDEDASSASQ